MTHETHAYLLEPGEGLLFTSDPWQWAARTTMFQDDTGLDVEQLLASPLFAHPLPILNQAGERWRGVPVEMLWHPFFWLPEHLARPAQFPDGKDGALITEDLTEWGVRVMLELASSDLYDTETGEWRDVLAAAGVDVHTTGGHARVEGWTRGGADALLDELTVAGMLNQTKAAGWARDTARAEAWGMREAQWSRTANALLLFAEANPNGQPPQALAKVIADTAAACFTDLAADPETGQDYTLGFRAYAFEAARIDPAEEFRIDYVLNSVKLLLIEVEETYRPSRDQMFRLLTPPETV